MNEYEKAKQASIYLKTLLPNTPTMGIVLGSGLQSLSDRLEKPIRVNFSEIPFFPKRSIDNDPGYFLFGALKGVYVAIIVNRYHYYEGIRLQEIALPIRVMKLLGIYTFLITNACGAINETFTPGDFMLISDHLNMVGNNPLIGKNEEDFGPRFPDASEIYSLEFRKIAREVANELHLKIQEGIYAFWSGPSYETPAEIRMLRILGADAVGMSTVPEALTASHMGMKVLGISCLTNMGTGIRKNRLTHDEVLEVANRVSIDFVRFLQEIIVRIG